MSVQVYEYMEIYNWNKQSLLLQMLVAQSETNDVHDRGLALLFCSCTLHTLLYPIPT
jgi:hypothetical protein